MIKLLSTSRPCCARLLHGADSCLEIGGGRSGVLSLAMSSSCLREILPTFVVLGVPLPSHANGLANQPPRAGGVFITKVKLRSLYHGDDHRIGRPFSPSDLRLNAWQNSMMFTALLTSAGPMGGEGFAAPAGPAA